MKTGLPAALIALVCLAFVPCVSAEGAAPKVSIQKAIEIAQKSLVDRGLAGKVYIADAQLVKKAVFEDARHWSIHWSEELVRPDKVVEVGAKVTMDGKLVILLKN